MAAPVELWKALQAETIAEKIIPAYHPHLFAAKILYLHTDQPMKSKGKAVLGKTTKPSSLARFLASGLKAVAEGPDFILVFPQGPWEALDDAQREALVDHELMHCGYEESHKEGEDGRFVLLGHDFEGFVVEIERYGPWHTDAQKMAKAMKQLSLPLSELGGRRGYEGA